MGESLERLIKKTHHRGGWPRWWLWTSASQKGFLIGSDAVAERSGLLPVSFHPSLLPSSASSSSPSLLLRLRVRRRALPFHAPQRGWCTALSASDIMAARPMEALSAEHRARFFSSTQFHAVCSILSSFPVLFSPAPFQTQTRFISLIRRHSFPPSLFLLCCSILMPAQTHCFPS